MIRLESFREASAAPSVRGDARIALGRDETGVVAHTGRIARWAGRLQRSGNREVTGRFVASLRERYGREVADHVVRNTGLDRESARGRPLRARRVTEIVGAAEALRASIVDRNEMVARSYFDQKAIGSNRTILEESLERESGRLYPASPDIHRLVDAGRLSRLVKDELRAAGNDGAHLVTTRQAEQVFTRVLARELRAARQTALRGAMNQMSFENPYSISRQALSAALAGSDRGLNINPGRFEADLDDALRSRLEVAVANRLPTPALGDDSALRSLADEVMEGFVAERAAACEAVKGLPIDEAEKGKLLHQVLHDDIPADMIPAMGRASIQVRDDLSELGKPLDPADLQGPLSRIHDSMLSAFNELEVQDSSPNRDAMYRGFWRFLLAPGGEAQAYSLAGRMGRSGDALRAVGEGAAWLRSEYSQTTEGMQTVTGRNGREQLKYAKSFEAASRYAAMMEGLASVLQDRTGAPAEAIGLSEEGFRLRPQEEQSDDTIAVLRNLGLGMPAPDRLGHENPDVPLSQPTLERLRQETDAHVESVARKKYENGMVAEARADYDRASFRIDGQELSRDKDVVSDGIRAFCTDANGRLNEEMLLSVSAVAYQAIPNGAIAQLFDPRNPETALFAGMPMFDSGRLRYDLSRNADGEVILNVGFSTRMDALNRSKDDGSDEVVPLDADRSRFDMSMELKLDGGSFRPTLEAINVGYSLFRGRELPGLELADQPTDQ